MNCHERLGGEYNGPYKTIAAMCADCAEASRTDEARALREFALLEQDDITNVDVGRPAAYQEHELLVNVRVRRLLTQERADFIVDVVERYALAHCPVEVIVHVNVSEQVEGNVVVRYPGSIRYLDGI